MTGGHAENYCFINSKRTSGFSGDKEVDRFITVEYELKVRRHGSGIAVTIPKAVKTPQQGKLVFVGLVKGTRTVIVSDNHTYMMRHFHLFEDGGLRRVRIDNGGSKLVHLPARVVRKLGIQAGDSVRLVVGKVLVYMFEGSEQGGGEQGGEA